MFCFFLFFFEIKWISLQVKHFLNNEAKGTNVIGATSLQDMVNKLKTPRKIMLLVKGKVSFLLVLCVFVINWTYTTRWLIDIESHWEWMNSNIKYRTFQSIYNAINTTKCIIIVRKFVYYAIECIGIAVTSKSSYNMNIE